MKLIVIFTRTRSLSHSSPERGSFWGNTGGQSSVHLYMAQEVHSPHSWFKDEHSLKTAKRLMTTSDDGPNYYFPMSGFQSLQYTCLFKSLVLICTTCMLSVHYFLILSLLILFWHLLNPARYQQLRVPIFSLKIDALLHLLIPCPLYFVYKLTCI